MCYFSWDLSACELFVLNGSLELVAKRESFIQLSPCSEAIQSLYTVVHDKRNTFLKYDWWKCVGQLFFKMFRLLILQIALALIVIYFRYIPVIACVITASLLYTFI